MGVFWKNDTYWLWQSSWYLSLLFFFFTFSNCLVIRVSMMWVFASSFGFHSQLVASVRWDEWPSLHFRVPKTSTTCGSGDLAFTVELGPSRIHQKVPSFGEKACGLQPLDSVILPSFKWLDTPIWFLLKWSVPWRAQNLSRIVEHLPHISRPTQLLSEQWQDFARLH